MRLLYKHIVKDFFSRKMMVGILTLFLILISFLYYFVHFSVDSNLANLHSILAGGEVLTDHQEKYLVALQNNQVLIRNMTLAVVSVFALILILFLRHILDRSQMKIGLLRSMGFMMRDVVTAYVLLIAGLAFVTALVGLAAGYLGSSILIDANEQTYAVENLVKGINLGSLLMGIMVIPVFFGLVTCITGLALKKTDIALLIKHAGKSSIRPGITEKIIHHLPIPNKFTFKLTLKNISVFAMLLSAVMTFNIMFVLSVSLIFCGERIVESQTMGRTYVYDVSYDQYQDDAEAYAGEDIAYLTGDVDIRLDSGESIGYHIVGLEEQNALFQLLDGKGRQITQTQGVVLNPELKENYGVRVGDILQLEVEEHIYEIPVVDIAQNAALKTIYLPKEQVAEMLQQEETVYNGLLTVQAPDEGKVVRHDQIVAEVENSQTSNRTSAIINQSVGVVIGCLLIFLAVLIGLTNNMNNILIFHLLGYQKREINRILLDPYMVLNNILFVLTFPIGVFVAQRIQIMTSLATNDYMPFQLNAVTFFYMLVVLNVVGFAVRGLFALKVRRVIGKEQQAKYLYEW